MSQRQILIETPHSDFGDIVSQSLGREASCDVKVATSVSEALTHIRKSKNLDYALLDMDMGVEKVLEQGFTLRNTFPPISLILISKKYPPPEMEDLRPWKFLRKPFVQRELFDLVRDGRVTFEPKPEYLDLHSREVSQTNAPAWYMDEILATRNLVAATSNLVVQEAILISTTEILAHSGELCNEAVEECSRLVRKYLGETSTAQLIKPVRLNTTRKDHLLSATMIAVGIILALSFDAETPFDIMRSQTRYLTNVLKNPRLSLPEVHILPKAPETQMAQKSPYPGSIEYYDDFDVSKPVARVPVPAMRDVQADQPRDDIATLQETSTFDPYRNPDFGELTISSPVFANREPMGEMESPINWTEPVQPKEQDYYTQTAFVIQENPPVETNSEVNVTGELSRCSFTPTESSRFDVAYACLLVPRINTHLLDGNCARVLREELPKIFMAYGWRLEELIINQSYLQWVVRIPPTIAPAAHIRVIMRESSRIILSNIAKFSRNEFLREFWSPGYLLGGGRSLIPEAEIAEFIQLNHRQYYSEVSLHPTPKRELGC